jgi:hypothetical protein
MIAKKTNSSHAKTLGLMLGFSATALSLGACNNITREFPETLYPLGARYILKSNNPDDILVVGDPHLTTDDLSSLFIIHERGETLQSPIFTHLANKIANKVTNEDSKVQMARQRYEKAQPIDKNITKKAFEEVFNKVKTKWLGIYTTKLREIYDEISAAKGATGLEELYAVTLNYDPDRFTFNAGPKVRSPQHASSLHQQRWEDTTLAISFQSDEAARDFYHAIKKNQKRHPQSGRADAPECSNLTYERVYTRYVDRRLYEQPYKYPELLESLIEKVSSRYDFLVRIRSKGLDTSIDILTCAGELAGTVENNQFIPNQKGPLSHLALPQETSPGERLIPDLAAKLEAEGAPPSISLQELKNLFGKDSPLYRTISLNISPEIDRVYHWNPPKLGSPSPKVSLFSVIDEHDRERVIIDASKVWSFGMEIQLTTKAGTVYPVSHGGKAVYILPPFNTPAILTVKGSEDISLNLQDSTAFDFYYALTNITKRHRWNPSLKGPAPQ